MADKNMGLTVATTEQFVTLTNSALLGNQNWVKSEFKTESEVLKQTWKHWQTLILLHQHASCLDSVGLTYKHTIHLRETHWCLPLFIGMIKVHKPVVSLRPVERRQCFFVQEISKRFQKLTHKIIAQLRCYKSQTISHLIENSDELLDKLESNNLFDEELCFVTMDVKAMYPSMTIDGCLIALTWAMQQIGYSNTNIIAAREVLKFLLQHNFAVANQNIYYRRVNGRPNYPRFVPHVPVAK